MSSVEKKNVLELLRQMGSYGCPHFELGRVTGEKKGCCGTSHSFSYFPTCTLVNNTCPGIKSCPRLDPITKQMLTDQWQSDLNRKKIIDTSKIIKDRR